MSKCVFLAAALGMMALSLPAAGQTYLEFAGTPARDIPANCSEWHELFPSFCVIHHQDDYVDDGDGAVGVCDVIVLDGVRYHIDWVGPTYVLELQTAGVPERRTAGDVTVAPALAQHERSREQRWYEPVEPVPPADPVCTLWHQVHPDYCTSQHVDAWEDNGDGVVSECDIIWIEGFPWHVAEVNLDIAVTEEPSPAGPATWGAIKHLFSTF